MSFFLRNNLKSCLLAVLLLINLPGQAKELVSGEKDSITSSLHASSPKMTHEKVLKENNNGKSLIEEIIVKGTVLDQENGEGLPGVSVLVKGTSQGVITNNAGEYTIKVSKKTDVLVFSYVGYYSYPQF
jgi:hypothetical protein